MSQADPWAKIWWDWFVSRSHIGLSGVALALGSPLMLIGRECAARNSDANSVAWRDAKGDEHPPSPDLVWFRHKNGRPYTASDLAGIVRFSTDAVQTALDELIGAETLVISIDGCYGMPRFWKYQETAAAARMRRHRENKPRNSYAPRDVSGDGQKREERREKREEQKGETRASAPPAAAADEPADPKPEPQTVAALPVDPRMFEVGIYLQTFRDTFHEVARELGFRSPPEPDHGQLRTGARRSGVLARDEKRSFVECARELARAALEVQRATGKSAGLALRDIEPGTAAALAPPARPGRLQPTRGTTHEDFAHAPSEQDQLAAVRAHRQAKASHGT